MKILLISLMLITSTTLVANEYKVNVVSVYDGGTIFVDIPNWDPVVGKRIGIRVNGIDIPEIRGKCLKERILAKVAKNVVVDMVNSGNEVLLIDVQRGKYFRLVANVLVDGSSVARVLVKNKLAITYDGGTKTKDWCGD